MNQLENKHVFSGSYYVGRKAPRNLQAFLGTCVGVALYDETAGVGGLIHLLLPEPVSNGSAFQMGKYASTGFPVFLKALYDEGASKHRLKAFVAGGALVGPIESRDLHLDIGGRTVDTVMSYLKKEDIKVEKSETGGFFTCCLNLNMETWQCSIEPIGQDKKPNDDENHIPSADEIEQVMEGMQPIPQVALKILRLINEDEYDVKALTEEIRQDQVICARTLKFCNSVIFAGRKKIDSLDHAIAFLGFKYLVKLIISTAMGNFYDHSGSGYSLCKGGLYHHAIGTAIIAEKLANLTANIKPGLAYTAGLLHDIGKVVLDQYIASAYPLFYRKLFEEDTNFLEIEKSILGVDHTEIGFDLARKWSLPNSLSDIIRHHHLPEKAVQDIELAHIIYLADLLMSRFHVGFELERLNTESLSSRMTIVGFSIDEFPDIVDMIPVGVFGSSSDQALAKG